MAAARHSLCVLAMWAFGVPPAPAGQTTDLTGLWRDDLAIHLVQLELRHDRTAARVVGTLTLFGMRTRVAGDVAGESFEITSLDDNASAARIAHLSGRRDGSGLLLTIAQAGEPPVTMRLHRDHEDRPSNGSSVASASGGAVSSARGALREFASRANALVGLDRRSGTLAAGDVAGVWEFVTDDGTYRERLELQAARDHVQGTLIGERRGYFSGRITTDGVVRLEGEVRDGHLGIRLTDADGGTSRQGVLTRRGEYLVLRAGGRVAGYARPGTPLVRPADGSPDAQALARAVAGRVFQSGAQAHGPGSSVGGRTRLALCANGNIAYDASDLATTSGPGFGESLDLGGSLSRRGVWRVVLFAGAPAIMAQWQGTGTSYSLTAYFDVQVAPDGQSVQVNGSRLPVAGSC